MPLDDRIIDALYNQHQQKKYLKRHDKDNVMQFRIAAALNHQAHTGATTTTDSTGGRFSGWEM
jgi:hypothetical protein